jgi:transposase
MAHVLKMAMIQSIKQLHAAGWSQRRIARELAIDRGTVARHLRPPPPDSNAAIPPAEGQEPNTATFSPLPTSTGESAARSDGADSAASPNAAIVPADSAERFPGENSPAEGAAAGAALAAAPSPTTSVEPRFPRGRPGQCEPYRELIWAKLDERLSAQRIWQDLVSEHGFAGSYDSVKRFVRTLGAATPLPFRRMECGPGEEAQIDFGTGAPVVGADGKRRKTYVFRIVLSHSRKGYSEATFTQTTEDFFRCLENAFAHFGGVPRTLVIDNLKAAVAHPDWFDPVLTPKVQSFCEHYGTVILPTKPYMPRHKGKVEAGVKYVKNNGLKGKQFASLAEQNEHLEKWERTWADTRIHGTTKRQVRELFEQSERKALRPRPLERFSSFHEARRKVNRDGHVEVAKAYYSAPPEYLGREVWVRWDARLVRLFNHRFEPIAVHVRHEQGRFSTHAQHVAREKIGGLERGAAYLLNKVSVVGPWTRQWSEGVVNARGIEGTRVLQGLLALTQRHSREDLEKACEIALSHGCWRLKALRQLLGRGGAKQQLLPFLDEHPIIRPLTDYAAVVARAIHRQESRPSMDEGFLRHDRTETRGCSSAAATAAQKKSPPSAWPAGPSRIAADLSPPRPGYPSPGCASAEPDSVSPDPSTVVPPRSSSTSSEETKDE